MPWRSIVRRSVHNLRPLEREGFIVLREGAEDRRRRHIALTSKGKTKCREGLRLWQVAQHRFEHVFGRSEAAALRATLLGIAHHQRLGSLKRTDRRLARGGRGRHLSQIPGASVLMRFHSFQSGHMPIRYASAIQSL